MRYLVVIEEGYDSQGIVTYSVFSPDVLGCATTGRTREEVEHRMHQALTFHLRGIEEDGDPIPMPHVSPLDPDIAEDPTLTPAYLDVPVPPMAVMRYESAS